MFLPVIPKPLRLFLDKSLVWEIPNNNNEVFLTFDDGPHPEITPIVLDLLDRFRAKATFFLIANNAEKYPHIVNDIKNKGHAIGIHTYNHLNGWKTDDNIYLEDIKKASDIVESKLFRPPYGRILRSQIKKLIPNYKIIMWSVLSGDFSKKVSKELCYKNVSKNLKSGSIIVFHDSLKSKENMLYALPKVLKEFSEKGFKFESINFSK